jgi:hypothetical protein
MCADGTYSYQSAEKAGSCFAVAQMLNHQRIGTPGMIELQQVICNMAS